MFPAPWLMAHEWHLERNHDFMVAEKKPVFTCSMPRRGRFLMLFEIIKLLQKKIFFMCCGIDFVLRFDDSRSRELRDCGFFPIDPSYCSLSLCGISSE
jgi:hypothetical protein